MTGRRCLERAAGGRLRPAYRRGRLQVRAGDRPGCRHPLDSAPEAHAAHHPLLARHGDEHPGRNLLPSRLHGRLRRRAPDHPHRPGEARLPPRSLDGLHRHRPHLQRNPDPRLDRATCLPGDRPTTHAFASPLRAPRCPRKAERARWIQRLRLVRAGADPAPPRTRLADRHLSADEQRRPLHGQDARSTGRIPSARGAGFPRRTLLLSFGQQDCHRPLTGHRRQRRLLMREPSGHEV